MDIGGGPDKQQTRRTEHLNQTFSVRDDLECSNLHIFISHREPVERINSGVSTI